METRLAPAQTAGLLNINPRTLRRWSTAFAASLSEPAKRKGQKRFYAGEDVETLRMAQVELRKGKTIVEVAAILPPAATGTTATALTLAPEQNIVLGEVREKANSLTLRSDDHDQRIVELEIQLRELQLKTRPWYRRLLD